MEPEQQFLGLMIDLPLSRWKVWIVVAVMILSFLLSGCGGEVADYKTDLGDPSLYKERYVEAKQKNASLERKVDSLTQENSRLKAKNAALRVLKLKDLDLSQRQQGLDEREVNLSERAEQLKQFQEKLEIEREQLNDKAYQEGIKAGLLEKSREQIQDLKKDLNNIRGQLRFSAIGNTVLLISTLTLIAFIFLDKYGILRAVRQEGLSSSPKIIDLSNLSFQNKSSNAGAMEQAKDLDPKALPSENDSQSPAQPDQT